MARKSRYMAYAEEMKKLREKQAKANERQDSVLEKLKNLKEKKS